MIYKLNYLAHLMFLFNIILWPLMVNLGCKCTIRLLCRASLMCLSPGQVLLLGASSQLCLHPRRQSHSNAPLLENCGKQQRSAPRRSCAVDWGFRGSALQPLLSLKSQLDQ